MKTQIRDITVEPMRQVEREWFTRKDAAKYIGMSPDFIKELNLNGELRYARVNRVVFIYKKDLDDYLKSKFVWK